VVVLRPNMGAMMFDQGSGGYGGNGQRRKWQVAGCLCSLNTRANNLVTTK
jgi:hypothetical protein